MSRRDDIIHGEGTNVPNGTLNIHGRVIDMNRKTFTAELATEGKTFTATITTNSIDRDGEVLLPEGMITADFDKSGTVFWNHNYNMPIGKSLSLTKSRDAWVSKAMLAARPDDHHGEWFPDTVHSLMKQGIIKGVSVGFKPIEARKPSKKDIELFGDGVKRVYNKWKLLEFSVAPLPANQDALISAVSKGLMTQVQCKSMFNVDIASPPAEVVKPRRKFFVVTYEAERPRVSVKHLVSEAVTVAFAKRRGQMAID